jgi:hypothetical protein
MAEFIIKLADERGRVQEQVQTAATAEELRARFAHAGYHVFSVKARSGFGGLKRGKVKLEPFLIFNSAVSHADSRRAADSGLASRCWPRTRRTRILPRSWTTWPSG